MQGRIQVEQTITAPDLAQALQDEQGTFLVQQGGQTYLVLSRQGHSIVSFRAIGPRIPTINVGSTPENWIVTKVSDNIELAGAGLSQGTGVGQQFRESR